MSYKVTKFEINFKDQPVPVSIHTVIDGDETNYIVSIEAHENFEIKLDKENKWKADSDADVNADLLKIIIEKHEHS